MQEERRRNNRLQTMRLMRVVCHQDKCKNPRDCISYAMQQLTEELLQIRSRGNRMYIARNYWSKRKTTEGRMLILMKEKNIQ